jgi:conjugative relaxase-like TrwC/TraI family protein
LEDYYLGSGEAPGVWAGGLAASLGLAGVVEADDLRALVEGRDPTFGTRLVADDEKRKVRTFDVTLSPPKSVSLLWAFATPGTSSVVSIAHVEAVAAALAFLDERAGVTRQQRGGVRRRVRTSGLAVATFVHRTSREADPQLHTHCVIPNLVQRPDGSWVAIDGTPLYVWAKAAGSIYQEELRRRLSERLGVAWGPDRNGCREMLGFSEEQLERFSKRTAQIEKYQEAKGISPADAKERMVLDEMASLATRRRKGRSMTPQRLRARWQAEAAEVGLSTALWLEREVSEAARGQRRELTGSDLAELFKMLVDPEVGLCAKDSRFGEAQVIQRVAAFGAGQLTSEQIQRIAKHFLGTDLVVHLIDRDPSGRTPPRWSTVAHRKLEDRVPANLTRLRKRIGVATPAVVDETLLQHRHLGEDQSRAVRILAGSGPAVRALIAPPGHGKTTVLRAGADAAVQSGRPVVALATTNQAVGELRHVGLEASTVARFALDGCHLQPDSVIIVDELSQLPTAEADLILSAVEGCMGAQLWLVGDPLQTQPVRAGGLAPLIAKLAEQGRIPSATLTVNRRQVDR